MMRRFSIFNFQFSILLLLAFPAFPSSRYLLHNANWFDGDLKPAMDVLIDGDTVTATPHRAHPSDVEIIDATGKYVMPGFRDTHAHLLEHGRDEKGDIPPRIDWELTRRSLRLFLQHGVTSVRDPGSETEAAVTLRRMIEEGSVAGPKVMTAGRIINASPFNPEPFIPVRTAEDIRREIRWQKAAGVDYIKIYASMTPELTKVAIEEAHALKLPVIGHLQRTTWTDAARMGIDFIAHGASWSPDLLPESKRAGYQQNMFGRVYWLENLDLASNEVRVMIDELVRNRVVVDPTLIAYHTKFFGNDPRWLENPDNVLLPPTLIAGWKAGSFTRDWTPEQYAAAQKAWPKLLALTKLMFDRGVKMTVGTDSPTAWIVPGASFHDEMALLVSAGIPARAVLRMATTGDGVIVLTRNPLDAIRNTRSIEKVFLRGKQVH